MTHSFAASPETRSRSRDALMGALVTCVILACVLLAHVFALDALAAMASKAGAGKTSFGEVNSFLTNLRDGLLPLSIPLATIGFVGSGVAFMIGNQLATKLAGGVVAGLVLVLLGPSIIN